jgi:hypothetical protein
VGSEKHFYPPQQNNLLFGHKNQNLRWAISDFYFHVMKRFWLDLDVTTRISCALEPLAILRREGSVREQSSFITVKRTNFLLGIDEGLFGCAVFDGWERKNLLANPACSAIPPIRYMHHRWAARRPVSSFIVFLPWLFCIINFPPFILTAQSNKRLLLRYHR